MFTALRTGAARRANSFKTLVENFRRGEDGSIIVLSLFLLVGTFAIIGMSVDFMRFESRRAMLQSTADRAVLAATELDRHDGTLNQAQMEQLRRDIVIDHFTKAGFADAIEGPIEVITSEKFASVGVKARFEMDTAMMRFLSRNLGNGADKDEDGERKFSKLSAPAESTAVEGVANIEISLALDLSGSMRNLVTTEDGGTTGETKIEALHEAADAFATAVLDPKYADRISLSLVPYSEHVNAGPDLFNQLGSTALHNVSHCVEFDNVDFQTLEMDLSKNYEHAHFYQYNTHYNKYGGWYDNSNKAVEAPVCPKYAYERIVPLSQNLSDLRDNIHQLEARAGTSIFIGLKWATALLDPSMRPAISNLVAAGKIDGVFDGRPADYPVEGEATATQKVIVLMTDGQNSGSSRLYSQYYNTQSKQDYWETHNLRYAYRNNHYRYRYGSTPYTYYRHTAQDADYNMAILCEKAKDAGVIIFAVAVEATVHGETMMSECASSQGHYFSATGDEMKTVFEGIAKQITELRLSL